MSSIQRNITNYLLLHILLNATSLHGESLVRVTEAEFAHQVVEAGGRVWLATDSGAHRIDGDSPTPVLDGLAVSTLAEVNGEIWLGSEKGLFQVEGDRAEPILRDSPIRGSWITAIRALGDTVWVGTDRGLFRIQGDKVVLSTVIREQVHVIEAIDRQVWVGTNRNAYYHENSPDNTDVFTTIFNGETKAVSKIRRAGGSIWMITNVDIGQYGPCYQFTDGHVREVFRELGVITVAEIGSDAWFGTTSGLVRLVGRTDNIVLFQDMTAPVNSVTDIGGVIWIGTTRGLFRKSGLQFISIAHVDRLNVKGVVKAGGETWVRSDVGVFKLQYGVDRTTIVYILVVVSISIVVSVLLLLEKQRSKKENSLLPFPKQSRSTIEIDADKTLSSDQALRILKDKLSYLQTEEAKTSNPAQKFELREEIGETKRKIKELRE